MQANRNGCTGSACADSTDGKSVTQTIDQIEARAAAIDRAERDALARLAAFLRDLAVELPVESKLPVEFAKSAKTLGLWRDGGRAAVGYRCAMADLVRDVNDENEARAADELLAAMEAFPRSTYWGSRMRGIAVAIREHMEADA